MHPELSPRTLRALAAVATAAAAVVLFDVRQVQSADMAPSLQPGDWVLLGPGTASSGDVVRLADPLEPDREVLRRVLGLSGLEVAIRPGRIEVQGEALRTREMGRDDTQLVVSEANAWLVRYLPRVMRDTPVTVDVPTAQVFLLADNRDHASDSRHWGCVPHTALQDEVWLRVGPADAWRGSWAWRAQDGPWAPPEPVHDGR